MPVSCSSVSSRARSSAPDEGAEIELDRLVVAHALAEQVVQFLADVEAGRLLVVAAGVIDQIELDGLVQITLFVVALGGRLAQ